MKPFSFPDARSMPLVRAQLFTIEVFGPCEMAGTARVWPVLDYGVAYKNRPEMAPNGALVVEFIRDDATWELKCFAPGTWSHFVVRERPEPKAT